MKLNFDIDEQNFEKIAEKFGVLKNPIHLKILLILENNSVAMDEIHKLLQREGLYTYRESTYKALEKLVKLKFVRKSYNQEKKKIVYSLV